jgi:hypothetical protein
MTNEPSQPRVDFLTVISIAIVAYAATDMVHEAFGHGLTCLFMGFRISRISTVALEAVSDGYLVPASGSIANLLFGGLSLLLFHRARGFSATRYFLWLFALLNMLNGVGYLLFSGLSNFGDWSAVITGFTPPWAWRAGLTLVGGALYIWAVRIGAAAMSELVNQGLVARRDIQSMVMPSYFAGGVLMTVAAVFNPISPILILLSGAAASFGSSCGLINIPGMAGQRSGTEEETGITPAQVLPPSRAWIAAAIPVAAVFVGLLGPGIRFPNH